MPSPAASRLDATRFAKGCRACRRSPRKRSRSSRLDPRQRGLVGRAEALALERPADERDEQRHDEPGPRHTQDEWTPVKICRIHGCYSEKRPHSTPLDLKHLLKRGALLTAANWPIVAIQFVAQTTFYVLLGVPIVGAAILVAVLLGGDLAELLQGNLRDIFTTIAFTLDVGAGRARRVHRRVHGRAVRRLDVDVAGQGRNRRGPARRQQRGRCDRARADHVREPAQRVEVHLAEVHRRCARLFRPYLALGFLLMLVYALSIGSYVIVIVRGYQAVSGRVLIVGWTFIAALSAAALVAWITLVNLLYLLMQIAIAVEGVGVGRACRAVARFVRAEFRHLVGVFVIVFALVIAATFASALAWSGVGLIAFVPLVGLAVFPLQLAALLVRGLVFEYLGLTALGAYITLYAGYQLRQTLFARGGHDAGVGHPEDGRARPADDRT